MTALELLGLDLALEAPAAPKLLLGLELELLSSELLEEGLLSDGLLHELWNFGVILLPLSLDFRWTVLELSSLDSSSVITVFSTCSSCPWPLVDVVLFVFAVLVLGLLSLLDLVMSLPASSFLGRGVSTFGFRSPSPCCSRPRSSIFFCTRLVFP